MTIGRPERILTQKQLEERLKYWRHRLNLYQWFIRVDIVRGSMIDGEGRNIYNTALKESEISLIDPVDYEAPGEYDMEFMLVHELLHLIVEVNRHSSVYQPHQEVDLESSINSLCRTLLTFEDEVEEWKNG